jgi:C4-type Zn-finger protein
MNCPVCGSPTLRIDSPDDDIKFFAYLDMRKSIGERIDEQMEETYDYL